MHQAESGTSDRGVLGGLIELAQRLLVQFWPVLLLLLLRPALGLLTATAFAAVRATVDRTFPHDLPMSTGDWLRRQLVRSGLSTRIDILTAPSEHGGVDAYFPGSSFIQLSAETWLRRDPVGWATGAHELGHALNYRRKRALHALLVAARWGSRAAWALAMTFMVANLLFGSPHAAQITYALLLVAAVLMVLVLWDELWASQIGMRLLRGEAALDSRRLDGAYVTMGAAFLSYASGTIGTIAVVVAYPRVAHLTLAHELYEPARPLGGTALYFAMGLSIALIGRALAELYRFVVPRRFETNAEAEIAMSFRSVVDTGWAVPLLTLLALVWNQPLGEPFAIAFMLAALPGLQSVLRLLSPALPLLMLPLFMLLIPLISIWGPSNDENPSSPELLAHADLDRVRGELERGQHELRLAQLKLLNEPPLYIRLGNLVRIAYLPLLVLLWLLQ